LDSNTRGWVPFTQHTDSPNKHEYSNSFNTQEHFSQKREGKGKRKTRRKKKSKSFLVEEADRVDMKWRKGG
jgi:hypothetical protein